MTSSHESHPATPASVTVVRNPYRVLGLPGEASWERIRASAERLLELPEPEKESTPWDLPWLSEVPRTEADVERALTRLGDPDHRIRARLFWFHERVAETAVHELTPSTIRNALEGWSATSQPLARHDAAVVALLGAITLDPEIQKSSLWRRALEEWEEVLDLEAYWMDVLRIEMQGGFEHPASLADVREVRERGIRLVVEPLLGVARQAVVEDELPRAARTLAVLREALPEDVFKTCCGDLAEHVWGSFDADWSPSGEPPETPERKAPKAASIDTQNPGLWDFATEETGGDAEVAATGTGEPKEPADLSEPVESAGTVDPARPVDSVEPVDSTESVESIEPVDSAESVEPIEPADSTELPSDSPPADAVEPAAPPRPTDPSPAENTPEPPETLEPAPAVEREERPVPTDESVAKEPSPVAAASTSSDSRADRWATRYGDSARRISLVAAVASLVLVATAVLLPRLRSGGEAGATPAQTSIRAEVERRMDTIDAALAHALVERAEMDVEIGLLREAVEGYQVLVDDYERRMARRLPADREAYRRVVALRDEARERLDAALADRRALQDRIERLERISSGLIDEWNAAGASDTEATERLPSP